MLHFKFVYFKRLLILFLISFFAFCFWQVYLLFNIKLETEVVYATKISKTFDVYGIMFKDEDILEIYDDNQKIKKLYKDGDRVAVGLEIARKYSSENDIKNLEKIKKINERIENFEQMQNLSYMSNKNFVGLNKQIYDKYFDMLNYLNKCDTNSSMNEVKNNMVNYFNQKQILMGKVKNFNNTIEKLKKERDTIQSAISSSSQVISTPVSGYFVSSIDNLEKTCNVDSMKDFGFDDLKNLYDSINTDSINKKVGLKIITNPDIYFKVFLPDSFCLDYEPGSTCNLKFEHIGEEVGAKLVEFNLGHDRKNSVATFEINGMTPKIASLRKSKAVVDFQSYYGLKIKKSAIRINELNQTGVYVLIGSNIKFKLVDILIEGEDFILSKVHEESNNYVKELDDVIVKGKDIYEKRLK